MPCEFAESPLDGPFFVAFSLDELLGDCISGTAGLVAPLTVAELL
jgi:hypothetical protein